MDVSAALKGAIDFEHTIRDYYTGCARKVSDPKGQRIFAILAREEQGHVEYLESRLAEWHAKGVIQPMALPTLLPAVSVIQAEVAKLAGDPKAPAATHVAEIDYLKEALELERKTSAFYGELVTQLDETHRGLFERFLEIENGHVAIVQAEIDALAGHGHWFDFMEFSLEQ